MTKGRPKTRTESFVQVNVHPDVHRRIRMLAVRKDMPMYEVVERGIDLLENQIGFEQAVPMSEWKSE